MLSGLRYFEHSLRDDGRGRAKPGFSWGAIDMASVARCFLNICSQAADIFANESRLLPVNSPCYVLGTTVCIALHLTLSLLGLFCVSIDERLFLYSL